MTGIHSPTKISAVKFGLILIILLTASSEGRALDNGLALTPPMGWNSWNKFGCDVSEDLIRSVADAMASRGMRDAGFRQVQWEVQCRGAVS